MPGLPPYYQGSYFASSTSLTSSSRHSFTATSIYTTTSASFIAGPGELTGKGLNAFGKMALNGYRNIVVRRRLQAISSKMPHSDNAIIPGLEEIYGDLLELSRFGLYSSSVRTLALNLILRQIVNQHTTQLTQSLLDWPYEELVLFFSELLMCMDPGWTGFQYSRMPIHTGLQKFYSSIFMELPNGDHEATPFVEFIAQVVNTGTIGARVVVDSGISDVIQALYDSWSPRVPGHKVSPLCLACSDVLSHLATDSEGFESLYVEPIVVLEDGLKIPRPFTPSARGGNSPLEKENAFGHMASINCVLVGDGEANKTDLLMSYTANKYPPEYVTTVFDNYKVTISVGEKPYTLGLFDTAGQEDFDHLRLVSYPRTDVFLVCFNVVSPKSFQNVKAKWFPEVYDHCPGVPCLIVGTHIDMRDDSEIIGRLAEQGQRPITKERGVRLARELGAAMYVECSALTQAGLKNVFDEAIVAALTPPPGGLGILDRRWSIFRRRRRTLWVDGQHRK